MTKYEIEQVELEIQGVPYTEEEKKEMEEQGGFGFEKDEVKHNTGSSGLSYGFSVDDDDGSGGKPKSEEDQQWEDDFFEADEDSDENADEADRGEHKTAEGDKQTKESSGVPGNSSEPNNNSTAGQGEKLKHVDRRTLFRMPIREMQVQQAVRFWMLPKVREQSASFPGMVEKFLKQKGLTKWEIDETRRRVRREVKKDEEEFAQDGDFFETEDGEADGSTGLDDEGYDMNKASQTTTDPSVLEDRARPGQSSRRSAPAGRHKR